MSQSYGRKKYTEFIRTILADAGRESGLGEPEILFGQKDFGALSLWGEEARQYREALGQLKEEFGKEENISSRAIEKALQRAILRALDIPGKSGHPLEKRILSTLRHLKRELSSAPEWYTCYVPVSGLDVQDLPQTFGSARFIRFNTTQLAKIRKVVKKHRVQVDAKLASIQQLRQSGIWDQACAILNVHARDYRGALFLARREARATLDVLNFLSDLVPYNNGWVYLPGDASTERVTSILISSDHSFFIPRQIEGPLADLSLRRLKEEQKLAPIVRKVHGILRKANRTELEELLVAACQWGGRATVEGIRELSFLLHIVALESVILPVRGGGLSYKLRIRTAHLLGQNRVSRARIVDEVKSLYDIRSSIVHKGSFKVTDSDLSRARLYAKLAILQILNNRYLARFQTARELDRWFEQRILAV